MSRTALLLALVLVAPALLGGCRSDARPATVVDPALVTEVGAEFAEALTAPDALEILSLYPSWVDPDEPEPDLVGLPRFHGWPVLGHTDVVLPDEAEQVTRWLAEGVVDATHGGAAKCFVPRHGYRITKDGTRYDLVVCFQCRSLDVVVDGVERGRYSTSSAPERRTTAFFRSKGLSFDDDFDAARGR